jgi:hypothetical protein
MTPTRRLRPLLALSCAALALACVAGCASGTSGSPGLSPTVMPFASSASIWFHPLPAGAGPNNSGSTDFLGLFQPNAPWTRVASHTKVLGLYAGWILGASDPVLQQTIAFANAHNMAIELEAPSLQATATCGSGVEGYVPSALSLHDFTLTYLQRLKALGADVAFIKVDEPYFFAGVVSDPRACHWPVAQIAADVGAYAQLVKTVYPNAAVGDVEPIIANAYPTDAVTALEAWHDTYRTVTGTPFPFYVADIDFSNGSWPSIVKALESGTHQRGMLFGIIYIGDYPDTSDQEWTSKVVARFETYQGQSGGKPDFVLFQSWEPHPFHCLPESDPTTFTGAVDAYVSATNGV